MPVLHQKASGDYAKLCKAKPFIEMPCVGVGPHDGIELENPEAVGLSLGQAVQHQLFADMEAAGIPARRVLSALTMLELDGAVTQGSGKRFALAVTLTGQEN